MKIFLSFPRMSLMILMVWVCKMGLDMYLTARIIFLAQNVITMKNDLADDISIMLGIKGFNVYSISIEVGYWRKANHIHKWFVDNIQNGEDDCNEYMVYLDDLEKLKNRVEIVLNGRFEHNAEEIAKRYLPTHRGFFFGDDSYNYYYYDDLNNTLSIIEKAKKLYELIGKREDIGFDFLYRSSW